jgi:uncharacterized protein YndB with AHSA1/START domain
MNTAAQVSDEAVRAKTGKDWQGWFEILDTAGAKEMSHKQIVAYLVNNYSIEPWWQQTIAVTYEQARGLRQKHEKPEGFQISRSKTISLPVEKLYTAWLDDDLRQKWLPDPDISYRRQSPNKTLRATWVDGRTSLDIYFYPKGDGKTQVTVQHRQLKDAAQAEEMKTYWAKALNRLAEAALF